MKVLIFLLTAGIFGILSAATVFDLSPEQKAELRRDPFFPRVLLRAERALSAKPVGKLPERKSAEAGFWPRVVGIPLIAQMEALGWAYRITGETKYADKAIELLLAVSEHAPATHPRMREGLFGARGHIAYGLALGIFLCRDRISPEQMARIERCAETYISDYLAGVQVLWLHNYRGLYGGPAAMLALAFRDRAGGGKRLQDCIRELELWFDRAFEEKGLYAEGVWYLHYGMERVLLFSLLYHDTDGKNLLAHPKIRNIPYGYVQILIPGTGFLDSRNDADYKTPGLECLYLAILNRDPLAAYLWELGGKTGDFPYKQLLLSRRPPSPSSGALEHLPRSAFFPDMGYAVWRTGWGRGDVMFSVAAGPYPGGKSSWAHAQADKGHFNLYAFGEFWGIDSGYANDLRDPESRGQTASHSGILIDGKGQSHRADASTSGFRGGGVSGYAVSDLTASYAAMEPAVKRMIRHSMFIPPSDGIPAYAAVLDDCSVAEGPHRFRWQMIVPMDKRIGLRPDGALLTLSGESGEVLVMPSGSRPGSAVWKIRVGKPGRYVIWGRFRSAGEFIPAANSFFISVDDAKPRLWEFQAKRRFEWERLSRRLKPKSLMPSPMAGVPFLLTAGEHTVRLTGREADSEAAELFLCREGKTPRDSMESGAFFHLLPCDAAVSGGMIRRPFGKAESGKVLVCISASGPVTVNSDVYIPKNPRPPAAYQRLYAESKGGNPRFAALLIPLRKDRKEPAVSFSRTASSLEAVVDWGTVKDRIIWRFRDGVSTPEFLRRTL